MLPVSEQLKFFLNVFARRAVRGKLPLGPLRGAVKAAARVLVVRPGVL